MPRTRRVAIDGGFESAGNDWWYGSGSFESFNDDGFVEFFLPFDIPLGGNGDLLNTRDENTVNTVTLWSSGLLSLGLVTQAQIDFMASGESPIPGDGPGFPGEFFLFDYREGVEHDFYSFGIGRADYESPFLDGDAVLSAFFTFEEGYQIIIDENGFSILQEGFAVGGENNGYHVGSFDFEAADQEIEFDSYPDFFTYAGTGGAESIVGTEFDELFLSGAGADSLDGSDGFDAVSYALSAAAVSVRLATGVLSGGDAAGDTLASIEQLIGSAFADTLTGDSGINMIEGGAGADNLNGGGGFDWLSYLGSASGVTVALGEGSALGSAHGGDATGDTIRNFENLEGSSWDDVLQGSAIANRIYGEAGNDLILGLAGDDRLFGLDGDDFLVGGAGADSLSGEAGNDTVSYSASPAAVRVSFETGAGLGGDAAGDFLFPGIENLIGSLFADTLTGSAADNRLDGGDAADRLSGRNGDDVLLGGAGDDRLFGENHDDTLLGGGGNDLLAGGSGVDVLVGGAGTDSLSGGEGNDTLWGEDGDDSLNGGPGVDAMSGGAGNDTYEVGSIGDSVTENAGEGTDRVVARVDYTLGANVENLTLAGHANVGTGNSLANLIDGARAQDTLRGLGGNDVLRGLGGNDTLLGGNGADKLNGGAGRDTLTGGGDRDVFQFFDGDMASTRGGADRITDFDHALNENIRLDGVDANTGLGGDQAFAFIGTGAFTGVAGQLRYAQADGNTYVEGDTNGDSIVDIVLRLDGLHTLVNSDFVL